MIAVDQKPLASPNGFMQSAYSCGKRDGNFTGNDLTRIFGISRRDVSEFGCNGCLPRFRKTTAGRWLYDPKKVAAAILDGHVWCPFMEKTVTELESFTWACDAFTRNIIRAGPCPDGKALRIWLSAVTRVAGEERLLRWMFKYYSGGVSENGNVKLPNHNKKKSDDRTVAEPGEVEQAGEDDDAVRIEEAFQNAMKSGMIAAPYLGQDADANRKKREAPIVIPNLEDV